MRPETESERQERHDQTIASFRSLVDPANPPRAPHLLEHRFFCGEEGDITGLTADLEEKSFRVETFAYDPDRPDHAWSLTVLRLELLEEQKLLALSDELDELARRHEVTYDGWMTRVGG